MAKVSYFTPEAVAQIKEIVRLVLRESQGTDLGRLGRDEPSGLRAFVAKTSTDAIPSLGTASVTVQEWNATLGQWGDKTDPQGNSVTETVLSFVSEASGTDRRICCLQLTDGQIVQIAEDCAQTST